MQLGSAADTIKPASAGEGKRHFDAAVSEAAPWASKCLNGSIGDGGHTNGIRYLLIGDAL
jgi:hypothetical protein